MAVREGIVALVMGLDTTLHLAGSKALSLPWVHKLSERVVEYPFVLRHLEMPPAGAVLDVGCGSSYFPGILAALGYRTYGIDIEDYPVVLPNFTFVKSDATKTSFPDSLFDRICAVSTIEHIGVKQVSPRRHTEIGGGGDRETMLEFQRILKSGGKVLLTVPYGGRGRVVRNYQRFYTRKSLALLLHGLLVEVEEYYARLGLTWTQVDKGAADRIEESVSQYAVACVVATKA